MPFSTNDLLLGGVIPIALTTTCLLLARRLTPSVFQDRYAAAIAVAAGFITGLALLSLCPWFPSVHWHWLPFTVFAASVVGPIGRADGVGSLERMLLYALSALVIGWLLIPTWTKLSPPRFVYLAGFVPVVTLMAVSHELIAKRLPGPLLPAILWLTMTAASIVVALSGSLRFAQIGIAGASALFGICVVAGFQRQTSLVTGLGLPFTVMTVGLLLVGQVHSYSDVPVASYLLVLTAPLLVWARVLGPVAGLSGMTRAAVIGALLLAPLAVAVGLAIAFDLAASE